MALKRLLIEVDEAAAGRTATSVLKEAAGISHSVARGLVDRGLVTINGRPLRRPAQRLVAGDRLETSYDPETRYRERPRAPRDTGFEIRVEDAAFLVVDKEAGLITVPAPSRPTDTLADRLLAMYAARGVRTPGLWVVHRIDRFTSGLVLFARDEQAFASLSGQFERREPMREYLAICEGIPDPPEGRLESWLYENPKSLKVYETRDRTQGRRAITRYRVESRLPGAALLRVTLETGRRHQIRVQLAGAGHPLVGDRTYGTQSSAISRVALHATRLAFAHPVTGERVSVESPLPDDMRRALRSLRHPAPS